MTLKIRTNNRARHLFALSEIPAKDRKDFDYLKGEEEHTPRLFRFKGAWYDAYEFSRIVERKNAGAFETGIVCDAGSPLLKWHGAEGQSYFDAVLVRFTGDGDSVVAGRATW